MYDAYQNTHLFQLFQLDVIQDRYFCTLYNDTHIQFSIPFSNNLSRIISICYQLKKKSEIPLEINDHLKLYGKEPWEVEYGEKCPICNVRIDEYGFCSCGSSGD